MENLYEERKIIGNTSNRKQVFSVPKEYTEKKKDEERKIMGTSNRKQVFSAPKDYTPKKKGQHCVLGITAGK